MYRNTTAVPVLVDAAKMRAISQSGRPRASLSHDATGGTSRAQTARGSPAA
jgi:hypothetical protein